MSETFENRAVLTFAILVSREDSTRWGTNWIARPVLTGHVAEARTERSRSCTSGAASS